MVDNDHHGNPPLPDVRSYYTDALTADGQSFDVWDLETTPTLPLGYMKAHKSIVWFTGASYPDPIGPYEANLTSFLDGGGRLFMSGQDILDQAAGTTDFFHDYVHIDWDGSEAQNDKATDTVSGVDRQPGDQWHRHRAARPPSSGRRVRGSDHPDRPGHGRLQG